MPRTICFSTYTYFLSLLEATRSVITIPTRNKVNKTKSSATSEATKTGTVIQSVWGAVWFTFTILSARLLASHTGSLLSRNLRGKSGMSLISRFELDSWWILTGGAEMIQASKSSNKLSVLHSSTLSSFALNEMWLAIVVGILVLALLKLLTWVVLWQSREISAMCVGGNGLLHFDLMAPTMLSWSAVVTWLSISI